MIFSILLTVAFVVMSLYALAFMGGRRLGKLLLVFYAVAVFIVWHPEASTKIANFTGIGRGVDFGLMLVSVLSLNLIIFLIHHVHQLHRQLTLLARSIALGQAITARSALPSTPTAPAEGECTDLKAGAE